MLMDADLERPSTGGRGRDRVRAFAFHAGGILLVAVVAFISLYVGRSPAS